MKSISKILVLSVVLFVACNDIWAMEAKRFKDWTFLIRSLISSSLLNFSSSSSSEGLSDLTHEQYRKIQEKLKQRNEFRKRRDSSLKEKIKKLFKDGAYSVDGWLHTAAAMESLVFVQALVELGVRIDAYNGQNKTPVDVTKNEKVRAYLKDNELLLFNAKIGNIQGIQETLRRGAFINVRDRYGHSPLHLAAWHARLEVVQYLVKFGADINAWSCSGETPLRYKNTEAIRFLKQKLIEV